ncbi:Chromosome partition protein Smc [Aquamicrobium terrae]
MSQPQATNEAGSALSRPPEGKVSSFLANLMKREKENPPVARSTLPSTDNLSGTLADLRDASLQVHHDFRSSTADLEARIGRLSAHLSTLLPVVTALHKAHGEAASRNSVLEDQNATLSKQLDEVRGDLADHKQKLADTTRRVDTLVEERERLQGEAERYQRDATELGRAKEALEFNLDLALRRTQELDRRLVEMEDEKVRLTGEYLDAKRTVARLTNDVGEARLALEARSSAYDETRKRLEDEQASGARARSELTRAKNDIQAMRAQMGHLEKEGATARSRYETQIEKMAAAIAGVERDRDAVRSRLFVVEKINGTQKRKLERAQEHIGYLQTVMRRLIGEGKSEAVTELDLATDDERDVQDDNVSAESLGPADGLQQPASEEEGVIRLPARRRG